MPSAPFSSLFMADRGARHLCIFIALFCRVNAVSLAMAIFASLEQYCLRREVLFFPRVPHRSGALEARGRGVTLGPSPGERKRERESP